MSKIVLEKESYQLMGLLFEVYNELGPIGYEEKHFQQAVELKLKKNKIPFESQAEIKIPYENDSIGKFYADLVVGKSPKEIILELKKSRYITLDDIRQVHRYVVNFGKKSGLQYKRVLLGKNK